MSTEKIIDKIKKLMAHSESAKKTGSLAEAELFAQKATELLMEHNLNLADIIMNADETDDKFSKWMYSENIKCSDNQSGNRWKANLGKTLAKYNLCKVMFESDKKSFSVYGNKDNVDTVVWLFNFMSTVLLPIAQEAHVNLPPFEKSYWNRYAFLKDFLLGAAAGIAEKLEEQQEASRHAAAIHSLIVYNDKALEEYKQKIWPNSTTFNNKTLRVGLSAYEKGVEAGKGLTVGGKLTAEKIIEKKLLNR